MQEYVQQSIEERFAQARVRFGELLEWLDSPGAGGLEHGRLEQELDERGRELLRILYQDHLDLRAAREQHRDGIAGADGVRRARVENGHQRALATVFGEVIVTQMAYRAPGAVNLLPADAGLNLPEEKHSTGCSGWPRSSPRADRLTPRARPSPAAPGTHLGKRQAEQLARVAATDVDAFYAARRPGPRPDTELLVLQADGKGIVMRPGSLREATAKAAAAARPKLGTRLSPGENWERKRMAEIVAVYDAAPAPRSPTDIISAPGHAGGQERPRKNGPAAAGKWADRQRHRRRPGSDRGRFDKAGRRDPGHARTWIALADGNARQIDAINAEAARRGVTVTIVCDFIHVLEYIFILSSAVTWAATSRTVSSTQPLQGAGLVSEVLDRGRSVMLCGGQRGGWQPTCRRSPSAWASCRRSRSRSARRFRSSSCAAARR